MLLWLAAAISLLGDARGILLWLYTILSFIVIAVGLLLRFLRYLRLPRSEPATKARLIQETTQGIALLGGVSLGIGWIGLGLGIFQPALGLEVIAGFSILAVALLLVITYLGRSMERDLQLATGAKGPSTNLPRFIGYEGPFPASGDAR